MSGEVFLMGNSSVTKAAGVIRVSYPANSTLVVKGTSSGKQFAKDTNTTSSAKAYIFLAPIGDASYTLTATNTAGKTASKQVYVAKDQVQSVVLAYEYVIFNSGGLNSAYSDGGGGATVTVTTDSSGVKILKFPSGGGYNRMAYLKPAVDLTDYKTLKISGFATADRKFAVWKTVPDSDNAGMTASVVIKQGTSKSSYTIDVSNLTGNYYLGTQYATGDTTIYELILE